MNIYGTKTVTFDDLPQAESIDLELSYHYEEENGFEEDNSITLPDNWEQMVFDRYLMAARAAIKDIKSDVEDRHSDVRQWAEDESKSCAEESAVTRYEMAKDLYKST